DLKQKNEELSELKSQNFFKRTWNWISGRTSSLEEEIADLEIYLKLPEEYALEAITKSVEEQDFREAKFLAIGFENVPEIENQKEWKEWLNIQRAFVKIDGFSGKEYDPDPSYTELKTTPGKLYRLVKGIKPDLLKKFIAQGIEPKGSTEKAREEIIKELKDLGVQEEKYKDLSYIDAVFLLDEEQRNRKSQLPILAEWAGYDFTYSTRPSKFDPLTSFTLSPRVAQLYAKNELDGIVFEIDQDKVNAVDAREKIRGYDEEEFLVIGGVPQEAITRVWYKKQLVYERPEQKEAAEQEAKKEEVEGRNAFEAMLFYFNSANLFKKEEEKGLFPEEVSLEKLIGDEASQKIRQITEFEGKRSDGGQVKIKFLGEGDFGKAYKIEIPEGIFVFKLDKGEGRVFGEWRTSRRTNNLERIVKIYSKATKNGKPVGLLEEFVEGKTVQKVLDDSEYLTEKTTISELYGLIEDLEKFYVTHNDIRTHNILNVLIQPSGSVKLIDLGNSRIYTPWLAKYFFSNYHYQHFFDEYELYSMITRLMPKLKNLRVQSKEEFLQAAIPEMKKMKVLRDKLLKKSIVYKSDNEPFYYDYVNGDYNRALEKVKELAKQQGITPEEIDALIEGKEFGELKVKEAIKIPEEARIPEMPEEVTLEHLVGDVSEKELLEAREGWRKNNIEYVGSGFMGTVFKVELKGVEGFPDGIYALKTSSVNEYKVGKKLKGLEGIVQVYSKVKIDEYDNRNFVLEEFIQGENLEEAKKSQKTIRNEAFSDLWDALKQMHERGVIHNDVKG
ncbi:hypothetical protein HY837_00410, partial [archaeon]|nr:hypothetical protein [archaeon]